MRNPQVAKYYRINHKFCYKVFLKVSSQEINSLIFNHFES